ncbi:Nucleotide-binding universal stress protein, UspA family [Solimonas aquatica]|uniref:Nucleotide-binding universal stress protein, UspA family n=1 Tax=Solimonas aquatica TaxID=489703 RepID=A0A1H8ZQM2_9GAMM|nr:universal stress protein [Solimonas aquatica]SEP65978.1 Nucleotide-binding universal stress protein, UspA family [Solimonas aquatica]
MKPLKKILLVLYPELRNSAGLRLARQLAERSGAQLQLLLCVFDPMVELAAARVQQLAKAQLLQQHSLWLDQLAAQWRNAGLQLQCELFWTEHAEEAVVARALEQMPDLVIRDLVTPGNEHGEHGEHAPALSMSDWRLARLCPAPLLLLRQDRAGLPRRIAVAADVGVEAATPTPAAGSINDLLATTALRMAIYAGAETHAVYSFPYRRPNRRPSVVVGISASISRLHREVHDAAVENFHQFARAYSLPEERAHWLDPQQEPALALQQFVREQHIDLLVLGSRQHRRLERLLLGSVSESLLRQLPCNLLLVKPPQFAEDLHRYVDVPALRQRYDEQAASADVA